MSRIAVIGAGIAGLAAARTLQDRGDEVVIFEKSSVPGGRIATRHVRVDLPKGGSTDLTFDYGAQYFTVRDPRFSEVVAYWQRDKIITHWDPHIVTFDGEGWDDLPEDTPRYVGIDGMQAIATHLADGLDIRFDSPIDSLDAVAEFDRVIVAVPANKALALLAHTSLKEQIAGVTMKPCWAVMAAFAERVRSRFDAAFVSGSPLGWITRCHAQPVWPKKSGGGGDAWVMHATADWSRAHVDDAADAVGPFLLGAFNDLIPAGLPKVFHAATHRWRYATADPSLAVGVLHDDTGRIAVCGDWCLGPRIESAYLSGLAAAIPSAVSSYSA